MQDNATEVTAAGIARLAGVGRAAVSNWRRRHADFPRPVGGTETSPAFALAEVEEWLRRHRKLAEVPLKERVWQQLAGHPDGPVTALVHAGCALLLIHDRPPVWLDISSGTDERLAALLPAALEEVLTPRMPETARTGHPGRSRVNGQHPVDTPPAPAPASAPAAPATPATPAPPAATPATPALDIPTAPRLLPSVPLLRGVAELAAERGARPTFEFLLGRHLDANPRQYTLTPPDLAALMAALAGAPGTVLDPACGTGALLRAVADRPDRRLHAQDSSPELAALTALRLALHTRAPVHAAAGDTLRADAYPELRADAVLCHPPFNERNWGHDDLAYDPRWEYGFPARTESELAWVQHALARLRDGGTAVMLMPPAVASRRSGRRIRADLLRRGALRAVVALPAGAAPPYSVPLHLWVLRRPDRTPAQPEVLLVDAGRFTAEGRGGPDWPGVRETVLDAWGVFDRDGSVGERPGLARSVPVIELLDDDVDLTPARRLPPPADTDGAGRLTDVRARLDETLRLTAELAPPPAEPVPSAAASGRHPLTTVGELARAGALVMRTGGHGGHARVPVLTDHDVLAGTAPSGTLPESEEEPVLTEPGDVVLPVLGGGAVARVVDEATAGAVLGRNLVLLRPDPAALDPWFLAGFLRGTANHRQASSYASTATRLDVRRLQLPRLAPDEQRRYGERFRALDAFERALREAGRLGEQLVRGMYDGLTDGTIAPG
ncbi:putative DNA-binding transcriptional regulator AlpA [Streptomyces thermodiastaticus]|uniref:DNA-binding transcriptional regulator AlpA n=1 Tax=Streptomyces thermodiastaticus TaxID=44061 RepID=A0ABU0KKT1_9ACTN|nr:putative DNA-binding transcriptional regulator AlpA [Streptomyces thermodiastaticus]UVT10164.1 N-6 DNA methylase [Streptomyces thermocarboxydus]WSB41861.1 N-6 DNA methylase [Streptomyces cellulosae]WTF20864.1 N-6 DNA methylase [Streptomyces cellulosae]